MLNFKKFMCLALALVLCLVFVVACNKGDESSSSSSSSSVETPTSSEEPSSSESEESSEQEDVVTSIREGEELNSDNPGYTLPVPPNYQQPQSSK